MENDVTTSEFSLFEETKQKVMSEPDKAEPDKAEPTKREEKVFFPEGTSQETISDITETDNPEEEEEKTKIDDLDLNLVNVEKIVAAVSLDPITLYIKVKEDENPIGVFGFYDPDNKIFIGLDGAPPNFPGIYRGLGVISQE